MAIEIIDNCRCDTCLAANPEGQRHIFADGHLVLTGPIVGQVMLTDGSTIDVTPEFVEAESLEHAAEISHAIGKHWGKHGHPHDFDIDEKTGDRIQRKFVYDDSHHKKHGRRAGKKG